MNKKNKIRICIVMGGHFFENIGGAQYQAQCLVDELIKDGNFEIFYLCRLKKPGLNSIGYTVIQISNGQGIKQYSFLFDSIQLYSLLKKIKPNVIYQRGLKAYTGVAAHYANKFNCHMVFHVAHDNDVTPFGLGGLFKISFRGLEKRFEEYGLRNADIIIAQTKRQAKMLIKNYNIFTENIIENFHPLPQHSIVKNPPIKVVWIANFKPAKRPEIFVELAKYFLHLKNVEFIMIGRSGNLELYANLYDEIKKLNNLRYFGELPLAEVNEILRESHIFVNTSSSEGFPNTFIQAWMRRIPVISLDIDPDNVLEKENIGFHSMCYEKMRDDVKKLIEDASFRENMGNQAQEYAFLHHSTKNAQRIISIFKQQNK